MAVTPAGMSKRKMIFNSSIGFSAFNKNVLFYYWRTELSFEIFKKLLNFCFSSDAAYRQDQTSRRQPRFRAYLQYCECCIFYFVIQLLSEPDKWDCWPVCSK